MLVASRPGKRADEGGNVSGYPVVDVAIGLSFVFLILSVFATSIIEAVAGILSYRAKSLEEWLAQNLSTKGDAPKAGRRVRMAQSATSAKRSVVHAVKGTAPTPTPEQEAAKHILGHPLVYAMTKGTSRPSYIPRERFVSALLGRGEQRDPGGGERDRHEELDEPADVEQVREDPAEETCSDPHERCREHADLLPSRKHEPPQRADDEPGGHEPEQVEREPDERPRQ